MSVFELKAVHSCVLEAVVSVNDTVKVVEESDAIITELISYTNLSLYQAIEFSG